MNQLGWRYQGSLQHSDRR